MADIRRRPVFLRRRISHSLGSGVIGNTAGFGPAFQGSSPCSPAKIVRLLFINQNASIYASSKKKGILKTWATMTTTTNRAGQLFMIADVLATSVLTGKTAPATTAMVSTTAKVGVGNKQMSAAATKCAPSAGSSTAKSKNALTRKSQLP